MKQLKHFLVAALYPPLHDPVLLLINEANHQTQTSTIISKIGTNTKHHPL